MTTIAWDGKTLAADRLANEGGLRFMVQKIFRLNDGRLMGISGPLTLGMMFVNWLNGGERPALSDMRDDEWIIALVVSPDGSLIRYEKSCTPFAVLETRHAIGSGRDFALAAMHLGQTAAQSVEIAAHFDTGTGLGVETLSFDT